MKIMKSYRLNKLINEEMKKTCKELGINETTLVEIAIIEKLAKISQISDKKNEMINCLNEIINRLERA